MKIHEHQGKDILKKFGLPIPDSEVAESSEQALAIAERLGYPCVIKAQIHAGGRGKGGGVKLAKTQAEAQAHAESILGMQLVTHQTGAKGQVVKKVLVEAGCDIDRELYLGVVLDRAISRVTLMASAEGGMDIEEVAANTPEKIFKLVVDPEQGINADEAHKVGTQLGLVDDLAVQFVDFTQKLYQCYVEADCTLAEINPLVVTKAAKLIALDAKINIDDNALFRHPDYAELRDLDEEEPTELEARDHGLTYVKLDGTIGCLVNGAGLAMATMDIIKYYGGTPANFLDVGGGATAEQVTAAFRIILTDPNVKAILVNIFGGIMRCDVIAEGIVKAAKEIHMEDPVVVRLQGTNVDLGKKILNESGLALISEDDLAQAARKVVELGTK